jgi:hypothetical protein
MTLDDFVASLAGARPPEGLGGPLRALWQARAQSWDAAHQTVQDLADEDAAWVHAHLHRVEGDLGNAAYWYRRAGHRVPDTELDEEWRAIVAELLGRSAD